MLVRNHMLSRPDRIAAAQMKARMPVTTDEIDDKAICPQDVVLRDGLRVPFVGLGTAPLDSDETERAILNAVEAGYRLFDTGAAYGNEPGVGRGLRLAGLPREELKVITKLRGAHHGALTTEQAVHESLERLAVDFIDLYLIHWPLPRIDKYVESWKAMIRLREEGLLKSIGTSNFLPAHLERLERETGVLPSVNQIEVHPGFDQAAIRAWHDDRGIRTLAYSPLGRGSGILNSPHVTAVAQRHRVTPAQVVLRWHIELGVIPLPRSSSLERQRENHDICDFTLERFEVDAITSAFPQQRIGRDPLTHEEF